MRLGDIVQLKKFPYMKGKVTAIDDMDRATVALEGTDCTTLEHIVDLTIIEEAEEDYIV